MSKDNGHGENPEFEYSYIDDGIFIGTNVCCKMHFDERLLAEGITADISLEIESIDMPFGVDYYLWLPVVDKTPPKLKQYIVGVDTIENMVANGIKVYVHCMFGHGRSPSLVAAYFIKKGKTVEEAIDLIKSKRDSIHLEDSQVESLREYEKFIRE